MKHPRVNCCVPGCRRGTTRFAPREGLEFICQIHWGATSKLLRRALFRARRRGLGDIADAMWGRLKKRAIEAAAGLG